MNITLTDFTPQVLVVPADKTIAQFLIDARLDVANGNIRGNISGFGKEYAVGIFDNADMQLQNYMGVDLTPTSVFAAQYLPGDFGLDGEVSSNGYNCFVAGVFKQYVNGPNDAVGFTSKRSEVITESDWLVMFLSYKLAEVQSKLAKKG